MKRFLTHPLLHFVVAGVVLYFLVGRPDSTETDTGDRSREIVITEGRVENLITVFQKTWQRPPTAEELQGLIDDFVKEEIYYREAIALGMDRDDTVIRRRMRQKIEFLTEDLATPEDPGDEVLSAYLSEHPDRYRRDAVYSLRQVFLDPAKHGDELEARIEELTAQLETRSPERWNAEDLAKLGDGLAMLGNRHEDLTEFELQRNFGTEFVTALAEAPTGTWTGPIRSGYGFHLVHIDERTEGRPPELTEVRDAVLRDWTGEQRHDANEQLYESLFHRYTVTFERADGTRRVLDAPTPAPAPSAKTATESGPQLAPIASQ